MSEQRPPTAAEIEDFYERFGVLQIRDWVLPNARLERLHNELAALLEGTTPKNALEVGCGVGVTAAWLRRRGIQVVGVDMSAASIDIAREIVPAVEFVRANLLDLDLGRTFDLITLFDVMEHVPRSRWPQLVDVLERHSFPEALIVISTPEPRYLELVHQTSPEKLQIVDDSPRLEEMVELVANSTLEIDEFRRFGVDYERQYQIFALRPRSHRRELRVLDPFPGRSQFLRAARARLNWIRHRSALRKRDLSWSAFVDHRPDA